MAKSYLKGLTVRIQEEWSPGMSTRLMPTNATSESSEASDAITGVVYVCSPVGGEDTVHSACARLQWCQEGEEWEFLGRGE